jgi:hypothetical protein
MEKGMSSLIMHDLVSVLFSKPLSWSMYLNCTARS